MYHSTMTMSITMSNTNNILNIIYTHLGKIYSNESGDYSYSCVCCYFFNIQIKNKDCVN